MEHAQRGDDAPSSTAATTTVSTPAAVPLPPPIPPPKASKPTIPAPARNAALMAMAEDDDDGDLHVCISFEAGQLVTMSVCLADWDKADSKDAKSSQPQAAAAASVVAPDDAASQFSEESGFDAVDEEAAAEAEKHQVSGPHL